MITLVVDFHSSTTYLQSQKFLALVTTLKYFFQSVWKILSSPCIRCYHSSPEWTWERWQWRGTLDFLKLQYYWSFTIRWFGIKSRRLRRGGLLLCKDAIGVFYRPRLTGLLIWLTRLGTWGTTKRECQGDQAFLWQPHTSLNSCVPTPTIKWLDVKSDWVGSQINPLFIAFAYIFF